VGRRYFSTATFDFLQDLELFNERAWFEANRERYERDVREPMLELIEDIRAPLHARVSPHLVCDPRKVGGSMFRIHRDVRFAKDKSPYKTQAGAFFRHDVGRETPAPGVYLHLEPGNCFVGAGVYRPPTDTLRTLRQAMADDPTGWDAARAMVRPRGWQFLEGALVRMPRGFPPDHPLADDLRRTSIAISRPLTEHQVTGPAALTAIVDRAAQARPLLAWLSHALDLSF
jgi:uncharacterized protein (TIGR02453 family)